jgi:hypothetical protein
LVAFAQSGEWWIELSVKILADFVSEDRAAIFRSDSESLIQIFEAIRHRALLRYPVCKRGEH